MAGHSAKARNIKKEIREAFLQNKDVTDPAKVQELRNGAIRALSNYLTIDSLSKMKKKVNPIVDDLPLQESKFTRHQRAEAERKARGEGQNVEIDPEELAKMAAMDQLSPEEEQLVKEVTEKFRIAREEAELKKANS